MFTYFDHDNAILRDLLRYLFPEAQCREQTRAMSVNVCNCMKFPNLDSLGLRRLNKKFTHIKVRLIVFVFYLSFVMNGNVLSMAVISGITSRLP